jgi:tetratricopeptide (TPR) repeat protein
MANNAPRVPPPTPEHRRVAAGQFERANQVIATGNYDYGIRLLLSSCKLEPANLIYRQALRRTEKTKYKNNLRGGWLAGPLTWPVRAKIKAALRSGDYLKVLDLGEQVLARNPWHTGAQMDMATAADALGLLDVAIWTLEQARQRDPRDPSVNRALARLYEKRGNFTQAIALWELIRKVVPRDIEAQSKAKDLAASETIARGHYENVAGRGNTAAAGTAEQARAATTPDPPPSPRARPGTLSPAVSSPLEPASTAERGSRELAQLRARIEADPTNANAYLHLASVCRKMDRLDEAREVLAQGLGPTGNSFEITVELADLETEPFRRNLVLTDEKLRATPDDEELKKIRIRLLKEINTREMDLYRRKADRYPTEMAHRFELGVRLLRADQVEEAIRELQAARSDPRHHWKALLYLAHCFKRRSNWRLAKRNFEECLQNLPNTEENVRKEVLFQLAEGHAAAGDLPAAIDVAHELANLDFGYKGIGRLLDEWQTRVEQADV